MPVREKSDGWREPEVPQRPSASVEREVDLSHAVDGVVSDGPVILRVTPMDAAKQHGHSGHHDRARRRNKLRIVLVAGAVVLGALPWALRITEVLDPIPAAPLLGEDALLTTMTLLKAVLAVILLGALSWRLRRRASLGRRIAYFAGMWSMAVGLGLVAIHEGWLAGTLLFDAGAVLLLLAAMGDDKLHRERPSGIPA